MASSLVCRFTLTDAASITTDTVFLQFRRDAVIMGSERDGHYPCSWTIKTPLPVRYRANAPSSAFSPKTAVQGFRHGRIQLRSASPASPYARTAAGDRHTFRAHSTTQHPCAATVALTADRSDASP